MRAAELMVKEAARRYEAHLDCESAEANMAKMLAADAFVEAAQRLRLDARGCCFADASTTSSANSAKRASTRSR